MTNDLLKTIEAVDASILKCSQDRHQISVSAYQTNQTTKGLPSQPQPHYEQTLELPEDLGGLLGDQL